MESIYSQLVIPPDKKYISVNEKEGNFLLSFIKQLGVKNTLEIGFAYGCSAAFIISATHSPHYVIDPFQNTFYENLGLKNIDALGLSEYLIFEQDFSHSALPRLLEGDVSINFAFIDGSHKFENIFLDFYYIDLMLNVDGYVIFHDAWLRSTQYVASWIRKNKKNYSSLKSDVRNLIVFRKNGEDSRDYYYFKGFSTLRSIISHNKKAKELKKRY